MAKSREKTKRPAADQADEDSPDLAETAPPAPTDQGDGETAALVLFAHNQSDEVLHRLVADLESVNMTEAQQEIILAEMKARAVQIAEHQAMLGRMTPMERAMFAFGLEERHVLGSRQFTHEDGSIGIVIVTRGGRKVRWPEDDGKISLSDMEKGDGEPKAEPAGIFPAKE